MNQYFIQLTALYQAIKQKQLDIMTGFSDAQIVELFFKHALQGAMNKDNPENVFYFLIDVMGVYNEMIKNLIFILKLQFVPILTDLMNELEGFLTFSFSPTYYFGNGQTIPNGIFLQVNA